ncbi:MAG: hypothetical protein Q7S03_03160 [bacterium]|nr:hypothetical protein [bacterium]
MSTLEELLKKKEQADERLAALNSEFKGIKHEDAHSELQDTEIRVLMDYIDGLKQQIMQLKSKK